MKHRNSSKKHPPAPTSKVDLVAGIAWYRADQWDKLVKLSEDRDALHDTHAEWEANALEKLLKMREMKINVRPFPVDVDEMVAWCKKRGMPFDGKARSEYVTEKMREHDEKSR